MNRWVSLIVCMLVASTGIARARAVAVAIAKLGQAESVTQSQSCPCGFCTGLTVDLQSSLNANNRATVSWTIDFVDLTQAACVPSGGAGTAWSGTYISVPSGSAQFDLSQDTTFVLSCSIVDGEHVSVSVR